MKYIWTLLVLCGLALGQTECNNVGLQALSSARGSDGNIHQVICISNSVPVLAVFPTGATITGGTTSAANGTGAAPSINFASSPTSGLSFAGGNTLQFSVGANLLWQMVTPGGHWKAANGLGQHYQTFGAQADSWGVATCATSTVSISFAIAYTSTPVIVVSDETTTGGARVSTKSNSGFTITCTGASDVVDYFTGGNPT
jgi:hypothetical protein